MINDNKNLSGVYLAGGVDVGQWVKMYEVDDKDYFSTLFSDLGIQFGIDRFIMDFFIGGGVTLTTDDYSSGEAGCVGCGMDLQANSMNVNMLALRLGTRVGFQF